MLLKHILVTRYNVRVPEWRGVDKLGCVTLNEEWMNHRWELFQRHTFPSILAQSTQDFEWLILCDAGTSIAWRQKLNALGAYTLYTKDWLPELQAWLRTLKSKWIATTRLDNDDAIAPTFMEVVQQHIQRRRHYINLTNGYRLKGDCLKPLHHLANPFITLVEPCEGAQSVYHIPHGRAMTEFAPIVQVRDGRLWTQIIHERNYIND